VVGLAAGPWTLLTYNLVAQGFRYQWGWQYVADAVPFYLEAFALGLGWPVAVLSLLGLVLVIATPRPRPAEAAMAALLLAFVLFTILAPAALQDRYILPAIAPALFLAWNAVRRALAWLDIRAGRPIMPMRAVATVFLALAMAATVAYAPAPPSTGLAAAGRAIWAQNMGDNPSVLVAMDSGDEGGMIAELAMGDPHRPSLFAVRGSRLLGAGGYNNQDYQPRFPTAAEAAREIDRYDIQFVIHQRRDPAIWYAPWVHVAQVAQVAAANPGRWQVVYQGGPPDRPVTIWRITDHADKPLARDALLQLSAPRSLPH
jgi:hypothetical protein